MHGGMINFLSYENGVVKLEMAGSCSGCAMSQKTLHEGVERMVKHYVPEVNQLVGVDDEQAADNGYTLGEYIHFLNIDIYKKTYTTICKKFSIGD